MVVGVAVVVVVPPHVHSPVAGAACSVTLVLEAVVAADPTVACAVVACTEASSEFAVMLAAVVEAAAVAAEVVPDAASDADEGEGCDGLAVCDASPPLPPSSLTNAAIGPPGNT